MNIKKIFARGLLVFFCIGLILSCMAKIGADEVKKTL